MRAGSPGRLARAIALAAAAGALAFPAAVGEPPRAEDRERAARVEPDPHLERVEAQLFARVPQLDDAALRLLGRTIVAEAAAARIDPLLVLALIEVESGFDPAARSGRGARGLMQLREPTLRRELERAGLAHDDPADPVANVRAGIRYLRRLLDAFGREEVALMAYNAGPNRILRYLRAGEIPERFHAYPRRVRAELRRLRRSLGVERGGPVIAQTRVVPEPQ